MNCGTCGGGGVIAVDGLHPSEWEYCGTCDGTGEVEGSADPTEESSGAEESAGG